MREALRSTSCIIVIIFVYLVLVFTCIRLAKIVLIPLVSILSTVDAFLFIFFLSLKKYINLNRFLIKTDLINVVYHILFKLQLRSLVL